MPKQSDITVVITSVGPPQATFLGETIASVMTQTLQPEAVIIANDYNERGGAAVNRQKGLDMVRTKWTSFVDGDDWLGPHHLEHLLAHAEKTDAALCYPWFTVVGGEDPFPSFYQLPWDSGNPRQTTITFLAKTEVLRRAGGFLGNWDLHSALDPGVDPVSNARAGEDFRLVLAVNDLGEKIEHLPERTWFWRHWSNNTSGLPSRVLGW